MDISIIIVSWNIKEMLRKCLRTIFDNREGLEVEVIVIDNDSKDGSAEMIRQEFPSVKLIEPGYNSGFARANNMGTAEATGKYIFYLNADTEVTAGSLQTMVDYLEKNSDVGMVGPKLVNPDNSWQQESIRSNPSTLAQFIILMKVQRFFRDSNVLKKYYRVDFDHNQEQEVDQIMGAAMLIRHSELKRAGYFDEGFFVWFEEVDLCTRFRKAGHKIIHLPSAIIVHHGGASFQKALYLNKQWIYDRSTIRYFRKHKSFVSVLLLLMTIPFNLLVAFIFQLLKTNEK